jgi:hypothetical protein
VIGFPAVTVDDAARVWTVARGDASSAAVAWRVRNALRADPVVFRRPARRARARGGALPSLARDDRAFVGALVGAVTFRRRPVRSGALTRVLPRPT